MYLYLFIRRKAWMSGDMATPMSHFLKSNEKENKLCDVTPFLYANVYCYSETVSEFYLFYISVL